MFENWFHFGTILAFEIAPRFLLWRATTALVTRIIRPAYSASSLYHFFFNAFDPARVLASWALWVQATSVKSFGFGR
jgi:hypothetical protein